jgi:hypothetical protein
MTLDDDKPVPPSGIVTEACPPPAIDPASMSDRELLLHVLTRIDSVDRRLEEGDRRFQRIEEQGQTVGRFVELLHRKRGDHLAAEELRSSLDERHPPFSEEDSKEPTEPRPGGGQ